MAADNAMGRPEPCNCQPWRRHRPVRQCNYRHDQAGREGHRTALRHSLALAQS